MDFRPLILPVDLARLVVATDRADAELGGHLSHFNTPNLLFGDRLARSSS